MHCMHAYTHTYVHACIHTYICTYMHMYTAHTYSTHTGATQFNLIPSAAHSTARDFVKFSIPDLAAAECLQMLDTPQHILTVLLNL